MLSLVNLTTLSLLAAIELLELHGPDGQTLFINDHDVSSLRQPIQSDLRHFVKGTKCIVVTTNGKFVAVVETCVRIRDMMMENKLAKQK